MVMTGGSCPFTGSNSRCDHQLDDLTGREMFAGLLVVLFVELADQFLEDVSHAEVGQAGSFRHPGRASWGERLM